MESILARALEYTLKYWLKSFTRDQFKLQGRSVQLSNLDINGDALHSSMGLPPALNVTTARVGKLEIMLPYVSNVQIEPIIVKIDRLDLVFEENVDLDASTGSGSVQFSSSSSPWTSSGYGFADKISDGMTIEVRTVNLLLETHGGGRQQGGAAWASPLASVTIRNLFLCTTNVNWQAVNLKEARDFSSDKKNIYVFKKLEWESLSIDLLPHPDMFVDPHLAASQEGACKRDDDGAKRVFFGGERFVEGISGQAYITFQRTELNSPLGLEVQMHISEVVCPALSEPGLRALLRFFTGLYVCLNRGDVDSKAQQRSTVAAGRSLVSIVVDHIFLCIRDAEFQLEFLTQSLFFSRASVSDGENTKNLTSIMIGGLFLRDTLSRPPCALVQPSMQDVSKDFLCIPDFAKNFFPPIYPLGEVNGRLNEGVPLLHLHSLQVKPSPLPPRIASKTVIFCQPLLIHLQEESFLRMCSFLADGIVVDPGAVLPDFSVNSLTFTLKELDLSIPVGTEKSDNNSSSKNDAFQSSFAGARLHMENLSFSLSPSLKLRLLNLEKDPACFSFWKGQPIDASQKKWTTKASHLSLCLEMSNSFKLQNPSDWSSGLWKCVEIKDACVEVAMATADGRPLVAVPPPGGIVRVGVACEQYLSNTSVVQLFFVLDLYSYFGSISEKIARVRSKQNLENYGNESSDNFFLEKIPGDTAVSLEVKYIQLKFLESCSLDTEGMPLVQVVGDDLFIKVSHRTLGGAVAISSALHWENVEVDCLDDSPLVSIENGLSRGGEDPRLIAVLWIHKKRKHLTGSDVLSPPFLDISMVQVVPYSEKDIECHSLSVSACITGVHFGGGMSYAEALLHRFGILGPDGGPGERLSQCLEALSTGPLAKLFKASTVVENDMKERNWEHADLLPLGTPDDVDVSIVLKDWLFAIEGTEEMVQSWQFHPPEDGGREERCWQTTFDSVLVKANSSKHAPNGCCEILGQIQKYPVELVTVGVEGLQILKPRAQKSFHSSGSNIKQLEETFEAPGGVNLEAQMVIDKGDDDNEMTKWMVESLKFSVKQPIETVMTKDELQHLTFLCKSEVDAMGRVVAGVLRILKLEGTVGQMAIHQLTNLGSEGFKKMFSPDKLVRSNGGSSIELTMAFLEEAVSDSRNDCSALIADPGGLDSLEQNVARIDRLNQRLEHIHGLLAHLRTRF